METLTQIFNMIPPLVQPFVIAILFFLVVAVVLPLTIAINQITLDFIHPPWGEKFRANIKSCFPPEDDTNSPRT